jgi:hypothetical protein
MEGRTLLRCPRCDRTREVAGEIPEEYTGSFVDAVREEGWVPLPGATLELICGPCFALWAGHETVDDEPKVRGEKDPKSL